MELSSILFNEMSIWRAVCVHGWFVSDRAPHTKYIEIAKKFDSGYCCELNLLNL